MISDDELAAVALDRPPEADDDTDPSEAGILVWRADPTADVTIEMKMLDDIEKVMAEAGAPEAEIERVDEDMGDDAVRLVIWVEGARFWIGALEFTHEPRELVQPN